jgi:hypothetical protein
MTSKLIAYLFFGRFSPAIMQRIGRRVAFGKIDRRANCPACGYVCRHDVKWDENQKAVMHLCKRCGASWGQPPTVPTEKWRLNLQDQIRVNQIQDYGNQAPDHNKPPQPVVQ